jgi:hypothetical protein
MTKGSLSASSLAPRPSLLMLIWLFISCTTGIHAQYQQRADAVLQPAPPAELDWSPDLRLRLSKEALQRLTRRSIASGLLDQRGKTIRFDPPVGPSIELAPRLKISELEILNSSQGCTDCLDLSVKLNGKTRWSIGSKSGKISVGAQAQVRAMLEVEEKADGQWSLSLSGLELRKLQVESDKLSGLDLSPILEGWVKKSIKKGPQISLGKLGGDDLPIRAIRVRPTPTDLSVEVLSAIHDPGELPDEPAPISEDWELQISQDTLLALMQRDAFSRGPLQLELAPDPRGLSLEDTLFSMDMRIWRLWGLGWWRDYRVDGEVRIHKEQLEVEAQSIESLGHSRWARAVDPLALLAERRILSSLEDGVQAAVPLDQAASLGDFKISTISKQVEATEGMLLIRGDLQIDSR